MQLRKVETEDEIRNRWERGEGRWGGSENGESGAEWEQGIYLSLGQLLALSAVWCLHDGGMNITHLLPPPHLFNQPWRECVWACVFWGGMATKVRPLSHLWRLPSQTWAWRVTGLGLKPYHALFRQSEAPKLSIWQRAAASGNEAKPMLTAHFSVSDIQGRQQSNKWRLWKLKRVRFPLIFNPLVQTDDTSSRLCHKLVRRQRGDRKVVKRDGRMKGWGNETMRRAVPHSRGRGSQMITWLRFPIRVQSPYSQFLW